MKRVIATILLLNLSLPILSGKCDDSAIHLDKAQLAPYDGYEITPQQAIKVRNLSIDNDMEHHVNADLTQENSLMNQRLTNAQTQEASLSKQLVEQKDSGALSKIGMFVLGAVTTGLISYGIYRSK